jgi:hypothetical protein
MKFTIKNGDGLTVRELDIKTSIREEYVFQTLTSGLPDMIARSIAKGVVYLANEPAATSVKLTNHYTVEKAR